MPEDRRVRRTQRLLQEALIALVIEKGYRNLTIQDVARRADIGYRTFFRHYESLDDLLIQVTSKTLDELDQRLNLYQLETDRERTLLQKSIGLFQFVQERTAIFRVLLLDDNVRFTLQPLLQRVRQRFMEALPPQNRIPPPILANHLVISTLALLRWWLEFDFPYPPEKMGAIFMELIIQPIWELQAQS